MSRRVIQRLDDIQQAVNVLKQASWDIVSENQRAARAIKEASKSADYRGLLDVTKAAIARSHAPEIAVREVLKGSVRMADLEEAIRVSRRGKEKKKDDVEGQYAPDGLSDSRDGSIQGNGQIQRARRDQQGQTMIIGLLESENPMRDMRQRFQVEDKERGSLQAQSRYEQAGGFTQSVGLHPIKDTFRQRKDNPYDPNPASQDSEAADADGEEEL